MDTVDQLALLVLRGKLRRNDGPYERHYPDRRDHMVRLIENRIAVNRRLARIEPNWPFATSDEYMER